ncbi:hypothetical protein, partial [Thiolapillus sp.]
WDVPKSITRPKTRLQPPSEMERALLEEVDFWKNYIEYCLEKDSASVPVAAYEALAQSEDKLQSYKSSTAVRRKLFVRIH